ncbi:MAG TPA: peptidyl-alpha-hydroxyglycine alpha-amidating lyase family protein [Thermoguttaceae bacterium]|nr:peptidyl-alpha-hydroxyglycine alpha-amidating lyase family protein [Thermoguttaceae bacterium]
MRTHLGNRVAVFPLAPGVVLLLFGWAASLHATAAELPTASAPLRLNTAVSYTVDPDWPQRPEGVAWGQMAGVAVDDQDRIWLHTRAKPPIQVYDSSGKFLRGFGDEVIASAHYLKIGPQGNIWVTDIGNHVVMQFTPEGKLLKTLGTFGVPGEDETHLNKPTDMAVTPRGDVFVSDGYGNNRIVHFDRSGKFVKAWGRRGTGPGEFNLPHGIVVDSKGRLYVADRSNVRVQVFDQDGTFLAEWRNLLVPWGLAITEDDEIWACGSSPMVWEQGGGLLGCPPKDQVFMKFDTDGKLLQLWTVPKGEDGGEQPGEVNWLHAIDVDSQGNIYAGDIRGQKAQKFIRQEPPSGSELEQ